MIVKTRRIPTLLWKQSVCVRACVQEGERERERERREGERMKEEKESGR